MDFQIKLESPALPHTNASPRLTAKIPLANPFFADFQFIKVKVANL